MIGELDAYLGEHRDAIAETALDLVGIDTVNPPGDTRRAVEYAEDWFDDLNVGTERVTADPAKPNLLASIPGEGETSLLYLGHLDTVPFDAEDWTHDPLGERDGERLYGRGTTDMKGAVAAMLWTARAFVETGTTPPVDLGFAFVSDEETGGDAGLPSLLERDALAADACVIGETTCEGGRHSVTVADRGSIWLTLEATGEPAHGSRPVLGENAIDRLYGAVETLREEFGTRPLELAPAVEPVIEESVAYYAPVMGEETARELFAYPTINLGTIEGGGAINAVPTTARAEIDVRLSPGVHTPTVIEEIRACARRCEGVTITDVSWSIGTYESGDSPFVEAVATTAEGVLGEDVYRRSATGGGDAKKLRNAGIPTVEFGVGTETAHAPEEYTTVDAIAGNALVYADLPSALADSR
jgi:succinyl-diaminopimelate desuccinylase